MKESILINVLTRTSNRPFGFFNCHQSIIKQNYKNICHWVSYENDLDKKYIDFEGVNKIKVEKYIGKKLLNKKGYKHAPYNKYCNELIDKIDKGWILFLDDDDSLLHSKVISEIVYEIEKENDDTLFIFQMRYPNGIVLPKSTHFKSNKIEINNIGSPCVVFHSKYKKHAKWDEWKGSDFRVINNLYEQIPNNKWIHKVYIQINNLGDFGNRNDISDNVTSKFMFRKSFFWFFIPKYHFQIFNINIFHVKTYKRIYSKLFLNKKYN